MRLVKNALCTVGKIKISTGNFRIRSGQGSTEE